MRRELSTLALVLALMSMAAEAQPALLGAQDLPQLSTAGFQYQASVSGRWVSSNINHAYEYEFDDEGNYVFQKVAVANGARLVLNGRGTYELAGNVLYCHQTEVSFAGRPGQTQDETWSLNTLRGTLARDGIVLSR
jgi:hypothetical protein